MDIGIIIHALIVNNKKECLIIRRSITDDAWPGYWDLPGGMLEKGEDPVGGIKREVQEEAGLIIHNPSLFCCITNVDTKKNKQFFTLIFLAKYEGGEISLTDGSHDSYAWLKPKSIAEYPCVHYMKPCFKIFEDGSHALLQLNK